MNKKLWQPNPIVMNQSNTAQFITYVNQHYQKDFFSYPDLYQWSILHMSQFWQAVWDFCGIIASKEATQVISPATKMQNTQWFIGAKLNFAENLLRRRDQHLAIIFTSEQGHYQTITYSTLYQRTCQLANYLTNIGVKAGDCIAGSMPNIPETIIAMLATTAIGAIWSCCSPDFGLQGLMDRFQQIKPKVLFTTDGYFYKGKTYKQFDKIAALQKQLSSIKETIVVPFIDKSPNLSKLSIGTLWKNCLAKQNKTFPFSQQPFNHPAFILYSSGTTGKPKCIVHSSGGTLIQHLKELVLHTNLQPRHRIFFNTTCGWMMWNWLVSSLAIGSAIVLYEGSILYPKEDILFDLIDKIGISIFGVGAQYFETIAKLKCTPKKTHKLSSLQTILTTGSPLVPESFDYVYQAVKSTVQLSSISGGSDIISCFALGNPLLPVYRGELQCIGLGMSVKIYNEIGHPVVNQKGELVCTQPFPSMPISFWNDPKGEKYFKAYFDKFPNVWTHSDYAKITPHDGLIIYGRSDTTLNPSGVRIGTSEIYAQIEKIPDVVDSLAVGRKIKSNEHIILFVVLRDQKKLSTALCNEIKNTIRSNTSPHHVPTKIIQVPELPRTKSGKLVEIAVKNIIHNIPVTNTEALANPTALDYFRNLQLNDNLTK